MKIKASLEIRINAAQRMIESYEKNIEAFKSGAALPDVGEELANRLLLKRKQKQLAKLLTDKAIRDVSRNTLIAI